MPRETFLDNNGSHGMNEVGFTDLPFATLSGNSQMDAIKRMYSIHSFAVYSDGGYNPSN